jgi:hypothetical protein
MAEHKMKVSKAYWQGGYAVLCSVCNKIGRGVDPDRRKAKAKAWQIANNHRNKSGGSMLGS